MVKINNYEASPFTKIRYIKDWCLAPYTIKFLGCLIATPIQLKGTDSPFVVSVGVSLCNVDFDVFNKEIAKNIALLRALKPHMAYKLKNRIVLLDDNYTYELSTIVNNFLDECNAYYKDKLVIYPKITFV